MFREGLGADVSAHVLFRAPLLTLRTRETPSEADGGLGRLCRDVCRGDRRCGWGRTLSHRPVTLLWSFRQHEPSCSL